MNDTIDATLSILRGDGAPAAKWQAMIEEWSRFRPSPVWSDLAPTIDADVDAAAEWLRAHLVESPSKGVYLGLDTLNMDGGAGSNVEIGGTMDCDPNAASIDWAWECEWSGEPHLIGGLVAMKERYEDSEVSSEADYLVFLGYSGLVLGAAAARLRPDEPVLFVWGFHDGDLFKLGRASRDGWTPSYA